MRTRLILSLALSLALVAPAAAQLAPLPVGGVLGNVSSDVTGMLGRATGQIDASVGGIVGDAAHLAEARLDRLAALVRRNADAIERDAAGDPARRGELLLTGPTPAEIDRSRQAGYTVLGRDRFDALDIDVVRLGVPRGESLRKAQAALARLLPGAEISADTLHFQSGRTMPGGTLRPAPAVARPIATKVGVIDGAPGDFATIAEQRGFASGAPVGSNHGSAVVSLLQNAGVHRIAVADVYGTDRAGGNALAIARALDWLVGTGARVVTISLVGPANPLLGKAIAAAGRKGITIVGAVGNDGPAAPPAYPASYPGVLAVTGVDGHDRPLIEAGRAQHLDYAAPGGDMLAANAAGRWVPVRGTSFAAPLVAARAAAALDLARDVVGTLDREARRIGAGRQALAYGRGLLCEGCRRTH